eukprot:gnl/TRDRNA2_/TRDRNA2_144462_c0_seq2.p1 gnl/TRDRNA2_/TRDRNA2_144462_c0~~gnl/TRDRNA2_/TRDRNA2_144462_c0_seq2.p1  ORF type:complete len:495 (-),score=96.14 gnl/TRDRNA2_/TRDRNA2_144462_c0_seq2:384-1748(-)
MGLAMCAKAAEYFTQRQRTIPQPTDCIGAIIRSLAYRASQVISFPCLMFAAFKDVEPAKPVDDLENDALAALDLCKYNGEDVDASRHLVIANETLLIVDWTGKTEQYIALCGCDVTVDACTVNVALIDTPSALLEFSSEREAQKWASKLKQVSGLHKSIGQRNQELVELHEMQRKHICTLEEALTKTKQDIKGTLSQKRKDELKKKKKKRKASEAEHKDRDTGDGNDVGSEADQLAEKDPQKKLEQAKKDTRDFDEDSKRQLLARKNEIATVEEITRVKQESMQEDVQRAAVLSREVASLRLEITNLKIQAEAASGQEPPPIPVSQAVAGPRRRLLQEARAAWEADVGGAWKANLPSVTPPVIWDANPPSKVQKARLRPGETGDSKIRELGCSCGYSCGTEKALEKHLERFPGSPDEHRKVVTERHDTPKLMWHPKGDAHGGVGFSEPWADMGA